jgi:hypothetical protein
MEVSIIKKATLLFLSMWLLTLACTTYVFGQTNYTFVQYQHTKLEDNINTTESQCVGLQFLNEPLNFDYKRVGLVEVTSYIGMSEELLIDYLKREALKINANYIINVERIIVNRKYGTGENTIYHTVPQYKGIAVFTTDERVVDVCCTDMGFLNRANKHENEMLAKKEENSKTTFGSIIGGIIVSIIIAILIPNESP